MTFGKISRAVKKGSHCKKWATFEKVGYIWKNWSHCEKQVTVGNMSQTVESGSY